jgi:hypothetical protein
MFDIYIAKGCRVLPEMSDLFDAHPELAEQKLHRLILSESPGFLGLNLPLDIARKLTQRLKYSETRALCPIIPARYRDNEPKFTIETARPIAEKTLEEIKVSKYPELHFGPTRYTPGHSGIMYITFASGVREWQDEGLIPGAIFASVDTLDRHIWTDEEMMNLWEYAE